MRLTKTNTAVKKQRVVCTTRILRHLKCCSFCELVALAGNERLKCKVRLKTRTDDEAVSAPRARWWLWQRRRRRPYSSRSRANLDRHDRDISPVLITQQLTDPRQQIGIHPVDYE